MMNVCYNAANNATSADNSDTASTADDAVTGDDAGNSASDAVADEIDTYATLLPVTARLRRAALQLSHRLTDSELIHITGELTATLNILLSSRQHRC